MLVDIDRATDAIARLEEALTALDPARPEQQFEARETLLVLADVLAAAARDSATARAAVTGGRIAVAIDDDALARTSAAHR